MKTLALDLSASSGRFIVISYDGKAFTADETYRFKSSMQMLDGHLRWDFDHIWSEIKKGLVASFKKEKDIASIGIDTFGVDYGRLDQKGNLLANPIGYRDSRDKEAAELFLTKHPYWDIYQHSGIQYLTFNTVFQLFDDVNCHREFDTFLLIPDLIAYFLTGEKRTELTNLSTTAFYDPNKKEVSKEILKMIGLDEKKVSKLVYPMEKIGNLKKDLAEELHIPVLPVIAVGSHDTASAVASIKLDEHTAYLSSGTWSLLGVELEKPVISKKTYKANFTNEIGLNHTVRFLTNIMGLFIIQELAKDFQKDDPSLSFQQLHDEAKNSGENQIFIDVDDELFAQPGDMKNKYLKYLAKTNQTQKDLTRGQIANSVYQSMACKYLDRFQVLTELVGRKIDKLVVVGGGLNAVLLDQMIADALHIEVVTGESEATIYGNAIAQLMALGQFGSLQEARDALYKSHPHAIYEPKADFSPIYQKYLSVTRRK